MDFKVCGTGRCHGHQMASISGLTRGVVEKALSQARARTC
jgi:polyribonucleotide nucleotidyltransferase